MFKWRLWFSPGEAVPACYTKERRVKVPSTTHCPLTRRTPRFFDNKYGLIYTENFLARVTALIDSEISDAECNTFSGNLFCHYTLTPCTPDGTFVLPFCKEDCLAIFKKMSDTASDTAWGSSRRLFLQRKWISSTRDCQTVRYINLRGNMTCKERNVHQDRVLQ